MSESIPLVRQWEMTVFGVPSRQAGASSRTRHCGVEHGHRSHPNKTVVGDTESSPTLAAVRASVCTAGSGVARVVDSVGNSTRSL